jgi:RimJ/RimL family protein N-acetyltransferase
MRLLNRPRVAIRRMAPSDDTALDAVFAGLSPDSRRHRYLAGVERLTPAMRQRLLDLDDERHLALVAEARSARGSIPVGVARYVVDAPGRAELAYEVVDAWHGRGIGSRLVRRLVDEARVRGIEELHGLVAPDNAPSLAVLRRALPQLRTVPTIDGLVVTAWLAEPPLGVDDLVADLTAA